MESESPREVEDVSDLRKGRRTVWHLISTCCPADCTEEEILNADGRGLAWKKDREVRIREKIIYLRNLFQEEISRLLKINNLFF